MPETENTPEPSPAPEPKVFFILDCRSVYKWELHGSNKHRYRIRSWLLLANDCVDADNIMRSFYDYETRQANAFRTMLKDTNIDDLKEVYERPAKLTDPHEVSAWTTRCYNIPVIYDEETKMYTHPDFIWETICDPVTGTSMVIPNGVVTYEISEETGFTAEEVEVGLERLIELKLAQ